jgi:murein DD-endopeptidase MepM/ murein hydrolase activator NlpD
MLAMAGVSPAQPVVAAPARQEGAPAPPAQGIHHPLERGQTIGVLAKKYGVPVAVILEANGIVDPASIPAGTKIFVPGAKQLLSIPSAVARYAWPVKGPVTSPFGATARRKDRHSGIDIAGDIGDPIHAAADGRVARIADNPHYGLMVVIEHVGGHATWYGHASHLAVRRGDVVTRGQVIAHVGETGNARGTHLHFEVRRNGRPIDPLPFLK